MGGDSAVTDSETMQLRVVRQPKVFINQDFIIGCCSSTRIMQLMQHSFTPPDQPSRKEDIEYLVTDFIDAIRTMQKDKGVMKKENELEEHDAQFLVGFNGNLYHVEEDFQVYQTHEPFAAVGAGADLALGALHALKDSSMSPEAKLCLALEAATAYNASVKPPFYVLKLEVEKGE